MSCKNCTMAGNIEISRGSFTLPSYRSALQNSSQVFEFFTDGFLEIVAHDLFAHVEVETQLSPSQTLRHFTASLPSIGLPAFEVSPSLSWTSVTGSMTYLTCRSLALLYLGL